MFPTLLSKPIPIHSYGLMIAIGFLVALYFMKRDATKRGIDPQVIGDMALWGLLLGIAGTRVLHIMMFPDDYSWSDPIGWIALWRGGLVFQGGPPVVAVFCYFYLKRAKQPVWRTGDTILPYLPLGHAFGRIGCFLNGCCYGKPTDWPWGIPFRRVPWDLTKPPTGSPAFLDHCNQFPDLSVHTDHWSHPVHATQLYSAVGLVCLCLVMLALRKKWRPFDGFTLPVYFILYSAFRFWIEGLRGDHNPRFWGSLSSQQVFCLASIGVGILLFLIMKAILPKDEKTPSV